MIQHIFIPKQIGGYTLIPQRTVGIEITKTRIRAARLYMSGRSVTLEQCFEVPIEADTSIDYTQRVRSALQLLAQQTGNVDIVRTPLSSALAITKELVVPFTEKDKIRLMLPFELEGHIPFPIGDAVIDFIITKSDEKKGQATISATAIQKQYIAQHLAYFDQTPFNPEVITLDTFDLYGLYKSIPLYANNKKNVVIIDINMHSTRMACITDTELRLIRTLPKGLVSIANYIAKKLDLSSAKTLENLIRFGLEEHNETDYAQTAQEALRSFLTEIQFTLQSFITQLHLAKGIDTIILLGDITTVPGIVTFFAQATSIPTEIFAVHELVSHNIILSTQRIAQTHILSVASGYPSAITKEYNLRQDEFAVSTVKKSTQQILTGGALACALLALLAGYSFWVHRSLAREVDNAEQEVVLYLQEENLTNESTIVDALSEAEKKAAEEQRLWFAFSRQRRFSFLEHLQKLSEAIDRVGIGLDLKKLVISENSIIFDGKVKDHDALKVFERELRESNLFSYVPTLQETTFTNMKLSLRKTNEVS